jgi:hypothetical protein
MPDRPINPDTRLLLLLFILFYMNTPPSHDETPESQVFGVIGPPGIGKTVAMNIVRDEANRLELGNRLNLGRPITVGVARKSTTRASRTEDEMKESGLEVGTGPGQFDPDTMIGVYTLSNNGAMYGYRPEELNKDTADLLIAEPSLHHLTEIEEYLGDRLTTTFLAATRQYRLDRLGGRGTEDPAEVRRRVIEGDSQIIMADVLRAPLGMSVEDLTDPAMVEIFRNLRSAESEEATAAGIEALEQYLLAYVQEPDAEKAAKYATTTAKNFAEEVRHLHVKDGVTYIANVVTVDESYLSKNPLQDGKFREAILAIVGDVLAEQLTA